MELKAGEYIRTDNGIIGKYIIKQSINYIDTGKRYIGFDIEQDIKAHSKNIIDLIEEGDYVGNCEIQYIHKNEKGETLLENDDVTLTEKDIKATIIVTKELFEEVAYRINE